MAMIGWQMIVAGDVVGGADGHDWTVEGIDHARGYVGLRRLSDGLYWEGHPATGQVDRRATATEVDSSAIATTRHHLAAAVISGPIPVFAVTHEHFRHPGVLQAHFAVLHDMAPPPTDDLNELVRAHNGLDHPQAAIPHTHGD